jgi:hypothetical protein
VISHCQYRTNDGESWSVLSHPFPVEVKLMVRKLLIVVFVSGLSVERIAQQVSYNDYQTTTVYITPTEHQTSEKSPCKGTHPGR